MNARRFRRIKLDPRRTRRLTIDVPAALHVALCDLARQQGVSVHRAAEAMVCCGLELDGYVEAGCLEQVVAEVRAGRVRPSLAAMEGLE